MADKLIRNGDRGDEVRDLQQKLVKLGYAIDVDGDFGSNTENAVKQLQAAFGYDIDGIVGPGTKFLIDQQMGYGWNKNNPDAAQKAAQAQGQGKGGAMPDKGGAMPQKGDGQQLPPEKMMGGAAKGAAPASAKGGPAPMDKKAPANKGAAPGKKM